MEPYEIRKAVYAALNSQKWHMLPSAESNCDKRGQKLEQMKVVSLYPHYVLFETKSGFRTSFLYQDLYMFFMGTQEAVE